MRTVLVANRGEIALRVFRTAHAMGLRTVALFTGLDATAPHLRAADITVRVPSYLDIDAVVSAAVETGTDVVHPGYGFLSERAALAAALEQVGIALAGPSATVMEQMGRKDAAREIAVGAGLPVVPSYSLDADPASFDYPIMVKAAAGGGGKGMRVVRSPGEYDDAVGSARREAASSFGDDTLLVEKYVESGRHLEVQVMADRHGTVLHLWERDCSTQRRHQKVLEEAPAPTIDEKARSTMTKSAVDLAREVGYVGAGTVEFLLDSATGDFYFLEMNTRLQVEHPVTEAITGLDLVELQLKVAAGDPLDLTQDDVGHQGWVIEARVYAEDAYGGFLPQAGTATHVRWPSEARVDHALESGQVVSTSYDPMLGKVIVHGRDRDAARRGLVAALDETAVFGLTTNTGFLRALAASEEFADATIDTAWLDRHDLPVPSDADARGSSASLRVELDSAAAVDVPAGLVDDQTVRELARSQTAGVVRLEAATSEGRTTAFVRLDRHGAEVVHRGQRFTFRRPDPVADQGVDAGDGSVAAPMPGTVLDVRVTEDQEVAEGDVLGVIEAMKMELALRAPHSGAVTSVAARAGDRVALGARLFVVTKDAED